MDDNSSLGIAGEETEEVLPSSVQLMCVVVKITVPFLGPYYSTAPSIQGTKRGP